MRFEVPQFIEIEDKIVGPLTWRQFVYLAGGVGVAIILFFLLPFLFFVLFALPVVALSGFLAFHRINNRPFSIFLESVVGYFTGSKLFLWKKEKPQTIVTKREEPLAVIPSELPVKKSLNALSRKLDFNTLQK
jgi:hypothetical protein